ncbi:hypothetical protein [Coprococcus sp. AF21-14LB]|uniref:hypothetical protein n=1 Tax=Coprococcus sp. AF21-14LB TaxID=2292231 RepID=UPI000E4D6C45|nr:hypothetical protein [Coprococcus sp. AF21-14LB]RGS77278.1 hypothetical protein DWX73_10680 [Coprococcus sp. AF21-14LB]
MIKETVLLFNFQDRTQLRKLEMLLLPMKIRLKKVAKEDYLKPLGSFVNSLMSLSLIHVMTEKNCLHQWLSL